MKVLMTADAVGGVWTYAIDLCRELCAAGSCVVLATMGPEPSAAQRESAAQISGLRLRSSRYKLEWMDQPWDDVDHAGEWLCGLAGEFRPDVVHLNGYAHGTCRWDAPVLMVGHSCVLSWWRCVKGCQAPPQWGEYRRRVAQGLSKADIVVSPTHTMLESLRGDYGPLPSAAVVPNGRSGHFVPGLKQPIVLCAGRLWDEAKNVQALARIAADVPWPVYIAGEDASPDGRTVKLNGAMALGRLEPSDLAQWMSRASIYVLPALYEPFGLSALEAALSGCALVLGDIPSLREVWGQAALYADPRSPDELLAALAKLIADPPRREALSTAAMRRARSYSVTRMARAYAGLYARLAGGFRQSSGAAD
jgi:glycosyltransferase involved in cell wall biosynthesis